MSSLWEKPQLIILNRGRAEEHILVCSCKSVHGGSGADHKNNKCDKTHGGICGACHPEPPNGGS